MYLCRCIQVGHDIGRSSYLLSLSTSPQFFFFLGGGIFFVNGVWDPSLFVRKKILESDLSVRLLSKGIFMSLLCEKNRSWKEIWIRRSFQQLLTPIRFSKYLNLSCRLFIDCVFMCRKFSHFLRNITFNFCLIYLLLILSGLNIKCL